MSIDNSAGADSPRFHALWEGLTEIMGTSATATLLRRAAKHAATQQPDLIGLVIAKPALEYEYITPHSWLDPVVEGRAIRALLLGLEPLLVELTGDLVVNRLRAMPVVQSLLTEEDS